MAELTAQHQRFVDEYVIDRNGKQAAIRAGYSEKTAEQQASRLLRNVKVQEAIEAKLKRISMKTELTAEWVLKEFAENHRLAREMGELQASNKALENIGKHLGMFTDKVKMDVQGEVSHNHEYHVEQQITGDPETIELLKQLYKRQAYTA